MAASLQFLDSDGVTVVTVINLGNIGSPGSSSAHKLYFDNNGNAVAQGATVAIQQVGTNDGSLYALVAPDVAGNPGVFGVGPLSLGNVSSSTTVPFWTKATLVTGLTPDGNPRIYTLFGSATSI